MTKHEKLMSLVEANQSPQSRAKDDDAPRVATTDAWLAALKQRYAAHPPTPHPAPAERKYQALSEDLNGPTLPPNAHEKFRRAALR